MKVMNKEKLDNLGRAIEENRQQAQPTSKAKSVNRTIAMLMGGVCPDYYVIVSCEVE